jgi:chromosome segregation ATPase
VACAIAAVAWKGPAVPAQIPILARTVKLRSEHLRAFADTYEEKRKIRAELESMEDRVQKGKIPRRRYKVRRKMLETRLATLDRDLEESKARIRAAGGQYLDFMRQLEVAETEIDEVETTVKSIEARHGRGEITLETYRKMLGDYERRRENAETTIDGILLRLREETR